ncbi:spore germination protein (amino acid permease) [Thermoflavimicrobium dichotomicum]|uniref:Spore germination protein (Amino acid permease) n=2 Tax=Thermoflavimicrobium dichotomicum TaxID=46223 RepID=A0A1I3SSR9_9BACL|nr:spore germination protein (amino acid permease) [Thermoflavimicrobium dichotomicum]
MEKKPATNQSNTLTPYQILCTLYLTIVGIGLFSLPRTLSKEVGSDGIWVIMFSGLIVWILLFFITRLLQLFPGQTFVRFVPEILGSSRDKKMGKIMSIPFFLLFGIYYLFTMASVIRLFGETLAGAVFLHTPVEAIVIVLILATLVAATMKPYLLAKVNEFVFPITFITFILIILVAIKYGEVTNLLPLFQSNPEQIWKGMLTTGFSFTGYEICILFAGYYQNTKKAMRVHTLLILLVTIVYVVAFVASLSLFGQYEITKLQWPLLEMVKEYKSPLFVLERFESGVIAIWVTNVFVNVANMYLFLVQMISQLYHSESHPGRKWIAWLFVPIVYALVMLPKHVQELNDWMYYVGIMNLVVVGAILFLYVVALFRRRKGDSRHASSLSSP